MWYSNTETLWDLCMYLLSWDIESQDNKNEASLEEVNPRRLKKRVFLFMQAYKDCNNVEHLKNDPLFGDVFGGPMASQPILSRFENSADKHALFDLCREWLARYVDSLAGRTQVTIDVDATEDPTHGRQQMSML